MAALLGNNKRAEGRRTDSGQQGTRLLSCTASTCLYPAKTLIPEVLGMRNTFSIPSQVA